MRTTIPRKTQIEIFRRDRWCCRYCGTEVFFSPALKVLEEQNPNHGYYHRNGRKDRMSSFLLNRCGAVDHIHPVTLGGDNSMDNLVTACWECNASKSNNDSEPWREKLIPLSQLDVPAGWDGLSGLIKKLDPNNAWLKYLV